MERSKPIVETIFGPLDSKRVRIDTDTIRSLNNFIRKIDPRAPLSSEKRISVKGVINRALRESDATDEYE